MRLNFSELFKVGEYGWVMNRDLLIHELTDTLEDAHRSRALFSFALVHVDGLDRIADSHGAAIAHDVVEGVAKRIDDVKRGRDGFGRWSEVTFGVLLKMCSPDDLAVAAERLLAGVRNDPIDTAGGPLAVTVTIAGITAPRHARTVGELVTRIEDVLGQTCSSNPGTFASYEARTGRATTAGTISPQLSPAL